MNNSYILAIDSTERALHICLSDLSGSIVSCKSKSSEMIVESLVGLLSKLCIDAQIEFSEIKDIVICSGPGSFTGIRSGIASALGISSSHQINLIGISAHFARSIEKCDKGKLLVPYLKINKDEVCYCIIDCDENGLVAYISEFFLGSLVSFKEEIHQRLDNKGYKVNLAEIYEIGLDVVTNPGEKLIKASLNKYNEDVLGQHFQRNQIEPLYVKPVNAKTLVERDKLLTKSAV